MFNNPGFARCADCGETTKADWLADGICAGCQFDNNHAEWLDNRVRASTPDDVQHDDDFIDLDADHVAMTSDWTQCTECGNWSQADEDYDICPHCRC